MLTCGQRPFQTCNRRRLRAHPLCNLSLSEARLLASLQQYVQEHAFFTFNALNFFAHTGPPLKTPFAAA